LATCAFSAPKTSKLPKPPSFNFGRTWRFCLEAAGNDVQKARNQAVLGKLSQNVVFAEVVVDGP
jgi:hypothetical protein